MKKTLVLFVVLTILTSGACVQKEKKFYDDIVAHRGASFDAPENTVAAYILAWEMNSPAAECDVYLTKDNKIVAIHDRTTKRTSKSKAELFVKDSNSADLRKLDVGSFKDPNKYAGEKIPFLEEIIATVPQGAQLFVEVKCGPEILPYLKEAFDSSGKRDQMVIIAFDFEVVKQGKRMFPEMPVYWLDCSKEDKETKIRPPYSLDLIDKAKDAGLDGLDLHYAALTEEYVKAVHDAGMKIFVWTVDEPADVARMRQWGVDGITTNKPDMFVNKNCRPKKCCSR